jgi:hypothetical protein
MTDQTSELQPLMYHGGQPYSRESAATALAEFDADKDGRVKAALGGDVAAQQERAAYWMMSKGHQPGSTPVMPSDSAGVAQQMDEREQQIQAARLDVWQRHIPMNDVARAEIKRGLVTQQQQDDAKREIRRMLDDKEFGAKVLAGHMDAKARWTSANLIASMRVADENYDWGKDKVGDYA